MSPTNGSSASEVHPALENQVTEPNQRQLRNRVAGLRNVSPALQFGFNKYRQPPGQASSPLDGLEALQRAVKQRELQTAKALQQTGRQLAPLHPGLGSYAAPLAPLRDRDTTALSEWFGQAEMDQIEADISRCLIVLWPAPCWEDDPFEFLEEHMHR